MKTRSSSKPQLSHQMAQERLDMALELTRFCENAFRERLKRKHPKHSRKKIEEMVNAWYLSRPGAEFGDCDPQVTRRVRLKS